MRKLDRSTQQTVYNTMFLIISAETAKIELNKNKHSTDNRFVVGLIPKRTHVILQVFKCQFTCHQKLTFLASAREIELQLMTANQLNEATLFMP